MASGKVEIFQIFDMYPLECGVKVLAEEISVGEEVLGQQIKRMYRSSGDFDKAVKGSCVIVEFEDRIPSRTTRRLRALLEALEEDEGSLNLHPTRPASSSSF
jgi:hypothetical protein